MEKLRLLGELTTLFESDDIDLVILNSPNPLMKVDLFIKKFVCYN